MNVQRLIKLLLSINQAYNYHPNHNFHPNDEIFRPNLIQRFQND